ncbi:MAG: DUF2199 domain-containing protein [Planctomycetota bacterium]
MRCSVCGDDHPIEEIEPAFGRPDAYFDLTPEQRERLAKSDSDLCRLEDPGSGELRWFVRAVLPVPVSGRKEPFRWGLWTEVPKHSFDRILELWSEPDQHIEPPIPADLANSIPTYPETSGLPCTLHLTGPSTRAEIHFAEILDHPLAQEFHSGVTAHRAQEWVELLS